jgi:hypothetical protein
VLRSSDEAVLAVGHEWAAAAIPSDEGTHVVLVSLATGARVLRVELEGEGRVQLRLDEQQLVIADERGRVRAIGLQDGRVLRDARLRA